MKAFQEKISVLLIGLLFFNTVTGVAGARADQPGSLLEDVKTLQTSIDSGKMTPAAAVDVFSTNIVQQNISVDQVSAFVKTQMTEAQYAAYQNQIHTAMNGIDPSTLQPSELGQIVGQALSNVQTTGLYWDGCASIWTGAAVIAAAVVAGIIAIVKSKSASSIQSSYNAKIAAQQAANAQQIQQTQNQYAANIASTKSSYQQQISDTNNWKTAFPANINTQNGNINNAQNAISNDTNSIAYTQNQMNQTQSDLTYHENRYAEYGDAYDNEEINNDEATITTDQNAIAADNSDIASQNAEITSAQNAVIFYQGKIALYTANPAQAAIDAQTLASQESTQVAQLQAALPQAIAALQASGNQSIAALQTSENSQLSAVPGNQTLAKSLEIGGGIGAAIGAGLLIYGIKNNDCGGSDD